MGQAIHIFKKDVRHLRFEIVIAVAVAALFAFIETKHALSPVDAVYSNTSASYLALILLPIIWWTLIGRVIHDEALPGDRQFWITRPYSWRSLLSAKILFILAFVNLPMLIAQAVIIHAYGFSIGSELVGLLWSQVLLTIVFVLPIIAMSALTTGFVQLIAGILTPCVIALISSVVGPGRGIMLSGFPSGLAVLRLGRALGVSTVSAGGYGWVQPYFVYLLIAVGGLTIILWQFRRRGTAVGRCFAGATVILLIAGFPWISWPTAFKIQSSLAKTRVDLTSAHLVYDLRNERPPVAFRQGGENVRVHIPLQWMGIPSGASAQIEHLSMSFTVPDGTKWTSEGSSWIDPKEPNQPFFVNSSFDGGAYLTRNDVPVKVHGTLYLTIFGNPHTTQVPFGGHFVPVAQVGLCSATESYIESSPPPHYLVICNSAFRSPEGLMAYRFAQSDQDAADNFKSLPIPQRQPSFSPFPAELRISPVSHEAGSYMELYLHPASQESAELNDLRTWDHAVIQTVEPLGHIRLDFDLDAGRATMYRSNNNEKIRPGG